MGETVSVEQPRETKLSDEVVLRLRRVMTQRLFARQSPEFVASSEGQLALLDVSTGRYEECLGHVVPWVSRHIDLAGAHVVEMSCGAGSVTAAFAGNCARVDACDADERLLGAARERAEIMGVSNAAFYQESGGELLRRVLAERQGGVDVVLCYSVLEHQTLAERLGTLKESWAALRPGGLLVVVDTPNRLTYSDHHTSFLPFFHMLPQDVAVAYAGRSPRESLGVSIGDTLAVSESAAAEMLIRWGRGVSYHEFELALGDLGALVVGDGFDREIMPIKPVVVEERLLYTYAKWRGVKVPVGFLRQSIDVILRKPGGEVASPEPRNLDSLIRSLV